MEARKKCPVCVDFYGNPEFNDMCSSCYKKTTPTENLSDQMRQQVEKEKEILRQKQIQREKDQVKQEILNTWTSTEYYPNREKQIEELKNIIQNDPKSRPQLAHDFIVQNNLWFTCQEAQELTNLATGSWIAYHVFFPRCINLYEIKEGLFQLAETGGGAGYYMEYNLGKTVYQKINNLSSDQLQQIGNPNNLPKNYFTCQLCIDNSQQCSAWQHGSQKTHLLDWTGYSHIQE